MYSKILAFVCIYAAIFNAATSQCVNRLPNIITENIVPNQVFYNQIPNQVLVNQIPNQVLFNPASNQVLVNPAPNQVLVNPAPNQVLVNPAPNQVFVNPPAIETIQTVCPSPATTTIIQDSTVANNLANALQLLIVSNLLGNTLPLPCPAPIEVFPNYPAPVEIFSSYPAPVEVFSSYPAPVEIFSGYPGPVEVVSQLAPFSSCGCGLGGFNLVY